MSGIKEETDVEPLRAEASTVKQCFTEYSFQALALSLGLLAVVFGTTEKLAAAVYAPLPAVGLLMAVCRIAVFKYGTANRNYGYELHLARMRHLEGKAYQGVSKWNPQYRRIDWEEALRAWRVVQPTLFRRIYVVPQTEKRAIALERWHFGWTNFFRSSLYQPTPQARKVIDDFGGAQTVAGPYPWFMPGVLVDRGSAASAPERAVYYAGSYLQGILATLVVAQYLMLVPLMIKILTAATSILRSANTTSVVDLVIDVTIVVVVATAIALRNKRITRRRIILEDELQSIHSCAIVWQAVVVCHYLALEDGPSFAHYSERLARRAQEVADNVFSLHSWLDGSVAAESGGRSLTRA